MATSVTLNAVSYSIPAVGDRSWGTDVSNCIIAIVNGGVLAKTGGAFTLTGEADFGATYGLKAVYYKGAGTISTAGVVRIGNTDSIGWRNAANSGNILLTVNGSDKLTFNSNLVMDVASTDTITGVKTFGDGTIKISGATSGAITFKAPAIAGTYVVTLFAATDTVVGRNTTDTLTLKTLTAPDVTAGSYINLLTQAAIRFNDDAGGDYVAVKAPTGVTTHTLTLPAVQGSSGTVLQNNGSGVLSWTAVASAVASEIRLDTGAATNNGYGTTNTKVRRYTNATTVGTDMTITQSSTNGDMVTINTTGVYALSATDRNTTTSDFAISLNATAAPSSLTAAQVLALAGNAAATTFSFSACKYLTAGDVVRVTGDNVSAANTGAFVNFRIARVA